MIVNRIFITLMLVITLCLVSCLSYPDDTSSVTFVQITDPHFGTKGYLERLTKTIKMINNIPQEIDFVVLTGDILNKGEFNSEFFDIGLRELNELKYPLHVVAGGRDIVLKTDAIYKRTFKGYTESFGEPITAHEYNGYSFIFAYISTLFLLKEYKGYNPLSEIRTLLEINPKKPSILFFHEPPLEHDNFDEWTNDSLEEFKSIIKKYRVIGIITGHWHQDALGWIEGVPVHVADSIYTPFTGVNVDSSFRIYTINGNDISYKTVEVE